MLYQDQQLELKIHSIAFGGSGIGQSDCGMTVFVPFTAPDELVRVRISKVKKRFAEAELLDVLEPSPWRVSPRDPNYGEHATTQYEHIAYDKQVELKGEQLVNQLERIGKIPADSYTMIPGTGSPEIYNYRNKLTLHPERATEDFLNYGFYGHDNHTIIPVTESVLVQQPLNELLKKINKTRWGKKNARRKRPLDCTLRIGSEGDTHLYFGVAPINYVWLKEIINGMEIRVPLGSFFQVNIPVAEAMFKQVANWVEQLPVKTAVDAYCGVGVFSAHLPAEMHVEAFDIDEKAIEAAYHNAMQLGLDNRNFTSGKDQKVFQQVLKKVKPADSVIILDPPRTGCASNALDALCAKTYRAIIMVSCNPSTMARDLAKLCGPEGPYQVKEVTYFDMFPQTAHFEAAALLEPKSI